MKNFADTLADLLVFEYGKTEDEARALVAKHTNIVMNGIMSGLSVINVRAAAVAIEMAESQSGESSQ